MKERHRTTWAELAELATIDQAAPCPIPECDEGWIDDGRCAGHICGWWGHYGLDGRLGHLVDELRDTTARIVAEAFAAPESIGAAG